MRPLTRLILGLLFFFTSFAVSFTYEFASVQKKTQLYISHWEDEISQSFLKNRDVLLLQKILGQLEQEKIYVLQSIDFRQTLKAPPTTQLMRFEYPLSYLGIPLGEIVFGIPIRTLLLESLLSPYFLSLLTLALVGLILSARWTIRDYQKTLEALQVHVEKWSQQGFCFQEWRLKPSSFEKKFAEKLQRGTMIEIEKERLRLSLSEEKKITRLAKQVAHDIKSPLSALQVLLADPGRADSDLLRLAATRIKKIIEDLHQSSKNAAEKKISVAEMEAVVDEAIALNQMQFPKIEIQKQTFSMSPSTCFGCTIQFARVFQNLLVNACEALQFSGLIMISQTETSENFEIHLKDHGVGIDPLLLSQLGVEELTTKKEGTGLGLTSVQQIMTENRGRVRIVSKPNEGCQITLSFLKAPQQIPIVSAEAL